MKRQLIVASAGLALIVAGIVAISPMGKDIRGMKEQELQNLEQEVVRIDLSGRYFDVPLRYLYGQAIEKLHQWPKAKKERIKTDALVLSVLLPDLRPYSKEEDSLWKIKGHGDRMEISIATFRGPAENWGKGNEINIARIQKFISEGRFYKKSEDSYGLIHYVDLNKNPYDNGSIYFAKTRETRIKCDPVSPPHSSWKGEYSPSCQVLSDYHPGLVLEYTYALGYLPKWEEIDNNVKTMFDRFAQAAQSEQHKKEK